MSKKLVITFILSFALMTSVIAVQAATTATDTPPVPSFNDGRINSFDTGAPVAIFNTRSDVAALDTNGLATTQSVISGIQLLRWNNDMGNTTQVINMSTADIEKAIAKNTKTDFVLSTANGYTLKYSQSGWFWVTAPADSEGKVYTFTWQKDF